MFRALTSTRTAINAVQLRQVLLYSSATQDIQIDAAWHTRLLRLRDTLTNALEPVAYINESADQVTVLYGTRHTNTVSRRFSKPTPPADAPSRPTFFATPCVWN